MPLPRNLCAVLALAVLAQTATAQVNPGLNQLPGSLNYGTPQGPFGPSNGFPAVGPTPPSVSGQQYLWFGGQGVALPSPCGAEAIEPLIGEPLDAADAPDARILWPGQITNHLYVPDRLNIHVSAEGHILRANCG